MHPVPSHPVLTCAEAKAWEAGLLKDEAAEWAAMQRAGTAIARAISDDFKEIGGLPDKARILVLVGKGHNGGDALLAAKTILEGHPRAAVDVLLCFGEATLRPLARRSLDELNSGEAPKPVSAQIGLVGACLRATPDMRPNARSHKIHLLALASSAAERAGQLVDLLPQSYDLCLDGVFGFQFHPPMDEATAGVLAWVNTHPRIRFRAAVDLPSGLGETNAGTVFRADFTYATGIVKSPVLLPANTAWVGRLRYLDLKFFKAAHPEDDGLSLALGTPYPVGRVVPDEPSSCERVLTGEILTPLAALRPAHSDKRTYGHLFVVGGSRSYPGAVLMTVQAALRSGVGLLTAFVPASLVPEYAARLPEAMWVGWPETADGGLAAAGVPLLLEKLPRATALVMGPGLGAAPETMAAVKEIVGLVRLPLLLDADALRPEVVASLNGKPAILTPHAGEFQRIAGQANLQEFAAATGTVVVRKGPLTQIVGRALCPTESNDIGHKARPTVYYSLHGGPVLARGGSGDILAGLTGGLLAQAPGDLLLAACRGVVWHGLAADLLARDQGQVAVQTTQLFDCLQPALLHAAHEST